MLILALDTATERGSLALVEDGRLLLEYSMESHGTYLTRVMPGVRALFQETGLQPASLTAVAVSLGPGNFTGLRIGLATAKTLAWSLNCPLVPVPTMEVLAAQFPFHPDPVGVLLDAKRREVFWGVYLCENEVPRELAAPKRLPVKDFLTRISPPLLLTGPGLTAYPEIAASLSPGITPAPPEMRFPRAPTLARLAAVRLIAGHTASPAQLVPTYLRPGL